MIILFFLLSVNVNAAINPVFNGSWGIESEALGSGTGSINPVFNGSWGISASVTEASTGAMDPDFSGSWGIVSYIEYYTYTNWSNWWVMGNGTYPVISNPNPANNSLANPINLDWNCTIKNPDGNKFNYSIVCSDGSSVTGVNVSNGSKVLPITGLEENKQYTVWVNATSNQSSTLTTRKIYYFSTLNGIGITNPSPANNSINNPLSFTWSCTIQNSIGDPFNYTINCSDGSGASGNLVNNGSKSLSLSGLNANTEYTVWVNATDGTYTDNATFYFNTLTGKPIVTTNATSGATGSSVDLNGYLSYDGGEVCTCSFEYGGSLAFGNVTADSQINQGNTFSSSITYSGINKTYYYRAKATNSNGTGYGSNKTFTVPGLPYDLNILVPGNSVTFSFTKGFNADNTLIVVNTSGYPSDINDGTLIYNGSADSFNWNGSIYSVTYYCALFSYNSTSKTYAGQVNDSVTALTDSSPPLITVNVDAEKGFDVKTGTINVTVNDNFDGNISVNISVNDELFNESVGNGNTTGNYSFNLSINGSNIIYVVATDESNNSNTKYLVYKIFYVNCSLVNERDGSVYNWNDAKNKGNLTGAVMTIPGTNITLDLYAYENTSFTYVSPTEDYIRINLTFENTAEDIIRLFNVEFLDAVSKLGLVEKEQQFYAQLIYGASVRPVIVRNVHSDCFIHSAYTYDAYEDYYSTQAVTINMMYYLYTYVDGEKVLLSTIEGSRASSINLEFLTYQNLSYEFSMLTEDVAVSKTTNTTLKIYYANLDNDNEAAEIKLYDGDNLVFHHVETEDPNEITLYFDYSTIPLSEAMLKLQMDLTRKDGSTGRIEKHIDRSGKVGIIDPALAALLSILICLFGFTIASSRVTLGYVGMIVEIIALGITVLATPVWYITFLQVIIAILLVITIFIFKRENASVT